MQTQSASRNLLLLRALRIVVRADSDPARQALFANLLQSHPWVRFVYGLHERIRGTWASAVLVAAYGAMFFLRVAAPRNHEARVLSVAQHANARRQVARICAWLGGNLCGAVRTGSAAFWEPAVVGRLWQLVTAGRMRTTVRLVRTFDRKYGFLVSCRAAAAIACYARARDILTANNAGAVLVSSDTNPEELGFITAARALGIPQVFVSHAYPTPLSPPLDFSLSILEGEAAVRARRRRGEVRGAVLLAGVEGRSGTMRPERLAAREPVIGIFTPKAISWPRLAAVVQDCRAHFGARQILIRWHPSMLEPPRLSHRLPDLTGIVECPRATLLQDAAAQCDWVIADENSNVHLPVLKLGVPTVAVKGLGVYPETRSDLYGFAADGIVYPPVRSIREISLDDVIAFFSNGWQGRFAQFDAAYLRASDDVGQEVRYTVARLMDDAAQARAAAT